jgi:hypothetical protein
LAPRPLSLTLDSGLATRQSQWYCRQQRATLHFTMPAALLGLPHAEQGWLFSKHSWQRLAREPLPLAGCLQLWWKVRRQGPVQAHSCAAAASCATPMQQAKQAAAGALPAVLLRRSCACGESFKPAAKLPPLLLLLLSRGGGEPKRSVSASDGNAAAYTEGRLAG